MKSIILIILIIFSVQVFLLLVSFLRGFYKYFLINPEKARIMKFSQIEACKVYYSNFMNNNKIMHENEKRRITNNYVSAYK